MMRFIAFLASVVLAASVQAKEMRRVIVTIKPIHSLVAGIMEGAPQNLELLIQDNRSPHTHQLLPSEARKLDSADVIIWVGAIYETGLEKRLKNLSDKAEIITISELPGVHLYPNRSFDKAGGCCHECGSEGTHDEGNGHTHDATTPDGHLWLSPSNAKALVTAIAQKLAILDRQNAPLYLANSEKVLKKLNDLTVELMAEVETIKSKPYMLVHDFTQYFDRYFGTKAVGVLRLNPNLEPTPQHYYEISQAIKDGAAECVFAEPQFSNKLVTKLVNNTGVNYGILDYLGVDLTAGSECYFEIMRRLVVNMKKGLKG